MAQVAAIIAAVGTVYQGVSEYQGAKYRAVVARNNAVVAEQQAQRESDAAQEAQRRSDVEYAATLGEVEAAQSVSGLDTLGRSQLAVRNRTRRAGRTAAEDIRRQGEETVRALRAQEQSFRGESMMANRDAGMALVNIPFRLANQAASSGAFDGGSRSLVSSSSSLRRRNLNEGSRYRRF